MGKGALGVAPDVGRGMVARTRCVFASNTTTDPPISALTNAVAPSAVKMIERGREAVAMRSTTFNDFVSTTTTVLSASQVT